MTLSKLVTWWLPTGSFELNPVAKDHLTIDPVDDVSEMNIFLHLIFLSV